MLGTHTDIGSSSNNDTPLFPDDAFSTASHKCISLGNVRGFFGDRIPLSRSLTKNILKPFKNPLYQYSHLTQHFFCNGWISIPWAKLSAYQLCFPFLDKETSRAFLSAKSLEVKWKVYGIPVYLHLCAFEHAKAGKNMKKCCIKREAKHQFSTPLLPPSSPSHPLCDIPGLSALAFGKGGGSSSKKDLPGGDTYHAIASCTISVTSGQDVRTDKTSMFLWYFCEKFALHCRIWLKHSHLRRSLCWCGFWNLQWKKSGNRPWNKISCIRLHKCKWCQPLNTNYCQSVESHHIYDYRHINGTLPKTGARSLLKKEPTHLIRQPLAKANKSCSNGVDNTSIVITTSDKSQLQCRSVHPIEVCSVLRGLILLSTCPLFTKIFWHLWTQTGSSSNNDTPLFPGDAFSTKQRPMNAKTPFGNVCGNSLKTMVSFILPPGWDKEI